MKSDQAFGGPTWFGQTRDRATQVKDTERTLMRRLRHPEHPKEALPQYTMVQRSSSQCFVVAMSWYSYQAAKYRWHYDDELIALNGKFC